MQTQGSAWKKKDLWTRRNPKFCVEVSRHTVEPSTFDPCAGVNRWAVYAYIYPTHRLFVRFDGDSMFQDAAACLPLHKGPSYLKIHRNEEGVITCYQVGADYNHAYDEHFAEYANEGDAYRVFADADELYQHLED